MISKTNVKFDFPNRFQTTYPVLPSEGSAQIRIFNTMNCNVKLNLDMPDKTETTEININGLNMYLMLHVKANKTVILPYTADFIDCNMAGYTSLRDNVKGKKTKSNLTASQIYKNVHNLAYFYEYLRSHHQETLRVRRPPQRLGL